MADATRRKLIAHNEGVRGNAIKLRAGLIDSGYRSVNLDLLYPGTDIVWDTAGGKVVGAQRKTIVDFMASYWNGSLQRQLTTMIHCVDLPVLLLEGYAYYDKETGGIRTIYGNVLTRDDKTVPYESYIHALCDLFLASADHFGIIMSPSIEYTIRWATDTGIKHFDTVKLDNWKRTETGYRSVNRPLQLLMGLDGIGEKMAEAGWKQYGTPAKFIEAMQIGIAAIDIEGIGVGIIKRVNQQLDAEYSEWHKGL